MDNCTDDIDIVVGGVDTHTAAALNATARLLGVETFAASTVGYAAMRAWLESFGRVDRIGIEGTGSYGAGLTRYLRDHDQCVVEVSRPSRQLRRRRGKSDPVDAEAAARATLAGDDLGTPKSQDGPVEVIRLLRLQRRSTIKARTQAPINCTEYWPQRVKTCANAWVDAVSRLS